MASGSPNNAFDGENTREQARREAQAYARERARDLAGDSQYTGEELRQKQQEMKAQCLARMERAA